MNGKAVEELNLDVVETQSPKITIYREIAGWIVRLKSEHSVSIELPSIWAQFDDCEVVPITIHYVNVRRNLRRGPVWLGNCRVAKPGTRNKVGMVDI